jgi:hypothetical protein
VDDDYFLPLIHYAFYAPSNSFPCFGTRHPSRNKLGEKHPTTLPMSVRLARLMHYATEQGQDNVSTGFS